MATAQPYIPAKEADQIDWGNNFAALLTATPFAYGITPADALQVQTAMDDYDAAYTLATDPGTRTPVTVNDKNSAKFAFLQLARVFAAQIRLNPGVSNENKINLGLNLPNNTPSPVPAPISWPQLTLVSAAPLQIQFKYQDSLLGSTKQKPQGAVQLLLFGLISTVPVADPETFRLIQPVTKSPFLIQLAPLDGGKMLYVAGRWSTRKGLLGPWSPVSSYTVMSA